MLKNLVVVYLVTIITTLLPLQVSAKGSNALARKALEQQTQEFVVQELNPDGKPEIVVSALPLDRRVIVKPCAEELHFSLAKKTSYSRQFPVKVTCKQRQNPWKLFVQVRMSEFVNTLVTTRNVVKGEIISEDMLSWAQVEKHRMSRRGEASVAGVVGGRAMRNIPEGYQVANQDVCLVCKGDDVAIIAQSSNMMIKTSGTAIENGAQGESIRVKNNSSERIVKGVIGDLKQVYVNL